MNETQKDWFRRMSENISHLRNQYHQEFPKYIFNTELFKETERKILTAVERLNLRVMDIEEYYVMHEFWEDEEENGNLMYLSYLLFQIKRHFN